MKNLFVSFVAMTLLSLVVTSCVTADNWQQLVGQVDAPLEHKYLQWGPNKTATFEEKSSEKCIGAYKVWYPADMAQHPGKKYPMVVLVNGTGWTHDKYPYIFQHLASWGFIAAGNMDESSGNGKSTALTLDYMLKEAKRKGSLFYGHVDTKNIGVAGHSQGGAGVFSAITAWKNSNVYKAAYSQSPTHLQLAKDALKFSYDITKVNIPLAIMCMSDTKGFLHDADDGQGNRICDIKDMKKMKQDIRRNHPMSTVILARIANHDKDHGANLRESEPYLVAWMRYYLMGDREAGTCFFGTNPEILHNARWQDVDLR